MLIISVCLCHIFFIGANIDGAEASGETATQDGVDEVTGSLEKQTLEDQNGISTYT